MFGNFFNTSNPSNPSGTSNRASRFLQDPLYEPEVGRIMNQMSVPMYQDKIDQYRVVVEVAVQGLNQTLQSTVENPIVYQLMPHQEAFNFGYYDVMVFYLTFDSSGYHFDDTHPFHIINEGDHVNREETPMYDFYNRIVQDDWILSGIIADLIYTFQNIGELPFFTPDPEGRENVYLGEFLEVAAYNGLIPIIFPIHDWTTQRNPHVGPMTYYGRVDGTNYTLISPRQGDTVWRSERYPVIARDNEIIPPFVSYGCKVILGYEMDTLRSAIESAIRQYNRSLDLTEPSIQFDLASMGDQGFVYVVDTVFIVFYVRLIHINGLRRPQGSIENESKLDNEFYEHVVREWRELTRLVDAFVNERIELGEFNNGMLSDTPSPPMHLAPTSLRFASRSDWIPLMFRYNGLVPSILMNEALVYIESPAQIEYHYWLCEENNWLTFNQFGNIDAMWLEDQEWQREDIREEMQAQAQARQRAMQEQGAGGCLTM
jgi:hypothetical protein